MGDSEVNAGCPSQLLRSGRGEADPVPESVAAPKPYFAAPDSSAPRAKGLRDKENQPEMPERKHAVAVNAAPDFRRIGVHKGARAAQFAPERCHSPSHTALSKLVHMPLKGLHTLSIPFTLLVGL